MSETRIQLLPDEVIGKIAAGEVVERPSAAIKELVENSLDAGATAVSVEIREGGISYFRVTDNGKGIDPSDIRMAFERHATSKIRKSSDLGSIATLGFRGEALASIAAVARVTCTTRTKEQVSGIQAVNEGGVIKSIEDAACPQGTSFVVRDLFFNTPVRLKFLKKPQTEAGLVSDLMMRMILSKPEVSFRYTNQGKLMYHSAGDGKLESAVFSIYGNELLHTMRRVEGCMNGVVLNGYVGIGESARGNRNHQSFFINGRYMRSNILSAALENGARERVMIGKYPTCVLHLTMPYDQVDVNVHPNKLEVRFQREAAVMEAVETLVREALRDRDAFERPVEMLLTPEKPAVPEVAVTKSAQLPPATVQTAQGISPASAVTRSTAVPAITAQPVARPVQPLPHAPQSGVLRESVRPIVWEPAAPSLPPTVLRQPKAEHVPVPRQEEVPKQAEVSPEQLAVSLPEEKKPLKLLGVAFNTFILVEYSDNLLLIDQHAVHERLLFDKLCKAYDQHAAGQELLVPLLVPMTRREQALLEENREILENMGLTVEPFGDGEVRVRSIPMVLGEPQAKGFLTELLDQLENERSLNTIEKRRASILQLACKKAVKGGDPLTETEIRDLVERMIDQQVTPTCPHGRPLVVALSHMELDKRFKRIQ